MSNFPVVSFYDQTSVNDIFLLVKKHYYLMNGKAFFSMIDVLLWERQIDVASFTGYL